MALTLKVKGMTQNPIALYCDTGFNKCIALYRAIADIYYIKALYWADDN